MPQNLVSLSLSPAQLQAVDEALEQLETHLAGLIALDGEQRKSLARMGQKSETFCRKTLTLLELNPQIVPPSLALTDALADLNARDAMRPRLQRLKRLFERAADTDAALGSDVMQAALQGYALLKVSGRNQGLEGLRKELGARFAKSPRATDTADTPALAHAA